MGREGVTTWLRTAGFAAAVAFVACTQSNAVPGALQRILQDEWSSRADPVARELQQFYADRDGSPAWVPDRGRLRAAVDALNRAPDHGFTTSDFRLEEIAARIRTIKALDGDAAGARESTNQLARLDTEITAALIALGRDVALGRTPPRGADARRKANRQIPSMARELAIAADDDLKNWPDAVRPRHPEYAALQHALAMLHAQARKTGWPEVRATPPLKPGVSNISVSALRERLAASGFLTGEPATSGSPVFDSEVERGVRDFQSHHGLKPTGIVDVQTLAALNVPIDRRIRQIEVNLERWRWMPDDLGPRHLLVNIPRFHLRAREPGRPDIDIRVIVGTPRTRTPIFSAEMTTVVFSPYWHIPDSIAEGETVPLVARDPGYLKRQQIEVLRPSKSGARPVDPSSVNWNDPAELRQLAFRQRPGPGNALGHVKFLFPNPYNVYLHDTPADSLFDRSERAFSHGCVRVAEPEALARYVLRDRPEWTDERILRYMRSGVEEHVKLDKPIPVHLVYFTAWVDDQAGLHFQPDIYRYDGK
jgi:murein L,D-transpeptidase YcbB/YkuD